jgi:hypothetical protein
MLTVLRVCRYQPDDGKWRSVAAPPFQGPSAVGVDLSPAIGVTDIGLYYITYETEGRTASTVMSVGPIPSDDAKIGRPPAGMIVASIPFPDHAETRFVPDPALHCR